MPVSEEQILDGLEIFVEEEIVTRFETPVKWIIGFSKRPLLESYLHDALPFLKRMGCICEDGQIDAEKFLNGLKESAHKYGVTYIPIPYINKRLNLSESDIVKLQHLIL